MCVMIKKKPAIGLDLERIVDKIRAASSKRRWTVTYSTNKEDRIRMTVEADT